MTSPSVTHPGPEPETTLGAFSDANATATPWLQAYDILRRAQVYWVTTVRPNGQPNVVPLLGVWALDGLCFCCGDNEQKHRNLQRNPHCVMTTGVNTLSGTDVVIEGEATPVDQADRDTVADAYESYYGWNLTSDEGTWTGMGDKIRTDPALKVYRLQPTKGFAFGKGMNFSQTRYRWR